MPFISWLWAGAFTLVGTVIFLTLIERVGAPDELAFRDYNLARIEAFDEAFPENQALRIVAIGNSRLKYATLDDQEMTELAKKKGAGRLGLLRLVNNWAVFQDFEHLTEKLLSIEPDVIVIQHDLLILERGDIGLNYIKRDHLTWQLLGYGQWRLRGQSPDYIQYAKPCFGLTPQQHLEQRMRITQAWLKDDAPASSAGLAREFIQSAAKAGILVVLLIVPASDTMEQARPSDQGPFMRAVTSLQELSDSIVLLRYPDSIPDDRFCDAVHMNDSGRDEFSAWFISELARQANS